jgi:hypothetical protein
MNVTMRAASCLAVLALACGTPAAHADPSTCSQPDTTGKCAGAHCHAGEAFGITVYGPGHVQGTALCGSTVVHCDGEQTCSASEVAEADSQLGCDLSQGTIAECWAGAPGLLGPLDPLICSLFVSLAPTVDGLIPELLYIDPSDGDAQVLNGDFYDCPPYGS